jgi:hypothetical protein
MLDPEVQLPVLGWPTPQETLSRGEVIEAQARIVGAVVLDEDRDQQLRLTEIALGDLPSSSPMAPLTIKVEVELAPRSGGPPLHSSRV